MGRRNGTVDVRATVAVSPTMATLRNSHRELNYFLYSTELSYGLVLTGADPRLADRERFVSKALANVYASAWYPSNQGRVKYRAQVSSFLDQLTRNMQHISRALLVMWYSHFENYLEERVRPLIKEKHKKWGPLTGSLFCDSLVKAATPVQLKTVLRADFCRLIRNLATHASSRLPDQYDHPDVADWIGDRTEDVKTKWACPDPEKTVNEAVDYVLGQAINHRNAAEKEGRRENLEHFYALFSFTNLDSLAVEIEEALLPPVGFCEGRITRKNEDVRRKDLIVAKKTP
jgi:hypothetical protein